jgi:hypothetical protein
VSTDDDLHARDRESYARSGGYPGDPFDPTTNVKALVEADRRRQDDLRNMQAAHDRELRAAEIRRQDEKAELRAAYEDKLRRAESDRIDAIRAVDAAAVQRAAEVQAAQQQALAAQVATTADAFRVSLAAALAPITTSVDDLRSKDIADLRRAQYETQGQKSQIVETRDVRADSRLNANLVVGVVGLLLTSVIIAVAIFVAAHGG